MKERNWKTEIWTIKDFMVKSGKIDCDPVGQRPSVSPNPFGESKPSKQQSIIETIMSGYDIGEVKLSLEEDGTLRTLESIDGGNRKRTILEFLANEFPMHKTSSLGNGEELYYERFTDDQMKYFLNYEMRFVIYEGLTPYEKGLYFRNTNNTTSVNNQEHLNSYGNIPIANAIRENARIVKGVNNTPHILFDSHKKPVGKNKVNKDHFPYIEANNNRLRLDELVARIMYMVYKDESPVVAPFESLEEMYSDSSLDAKKVETLNKKLGKCLDFLHNCALQRRSQLYRGILIPQAVMLYRLWFYLKKEYGKFDIEDYGLFWDEFEKAYNVFDRQNPKRDDTVYGNRHIVEAFHGHLGEHKTQSKFDNTIKWLLEEMDLEKATVYKLDSARVFKQKDIDIKWSGQMKRCWVSGEPLDRKDAQGGHIISYKNGGKTEIDNLVVISAEHNRRMQDQNAHDYKKARLAKQKKTA